MNLDKINYFITAAECLSFSKAAKLNYISQTAISQQIASMEKELGVKLFNRSHVRISLTEEGAIFYDECKKIMAHYNIALDKLEAYSHERKRVLTVGYSSMMEKELIVDAALNSEELMQGVELKFVCLSITELQKGLQDRTIDIVLTIDCDFPANIDKKIIRSTNMFLGVSNKHRLASKDKVMPEEIKDEKFIVFSKESIGDVYDEMLSNCKKDGFEPDIVEKVTTLDTLLLLVELNRGVAFLPDVGKYTDKSKIHVLEMISKNSILKVCVAWNKENSHLIKKFVSYL